MFETILTPVDGSPEGEGAIAHAVALARIADGTIHALSVIHPEDDLVNVDEQQRDAVHRYTEQLGRQAIGTVTDVADDADVDVVETLREGVVYREIVGYADESDVDLIVMGTRGQTARSRLGSTAERTLAYAPVPVVTVRTSDAVTDVDDVSIDRIVIPTDGSDAAERAAAVALEFAAFVDASVDVVYVVDRTISDLEDAPRSIIGLLEEGGNAAVQAIEAEANDLGITVRTGIRRGTPTDELLAYADRVDADLLAMGTRGHGETDDRLLGSTTVRVLRAAERPVLTVNASR
ncbi:universal stress protein [Natrarchaeobius chitinivorans]|uniref:Universal stress protein n=1 Tax=Natrarchaeobius chitinivorans TaxID=1679083 RepID=A0A3N6MFA8_NATCH|nr:universal stress protein [Natrarchaeobius chitinivorans]RQG94261.1 universal stress protein [Natrarchaeobius chitinivorans]